MKKTTVAAAFGIAGGVAIAATTATANFSSVHQPITVEEVEAVQQQWAEGIVAIGKAYKSDGDYAQVAEDLIDTLYAYDETPVLFKPTKAAEDQFRLDKSEAHSYFVKGSISDDQGFALQPWTNVRFDNAQVFTDSDTALAMGNYFFTDTAGNETKVEYSFGYMRDADGDLRIKLHHSSLPFAAN